VPPKPSKKPTSSIDSATSAWSFDGGAATCG
jgi:hypothetical protein